MNGIQVFNSNQFGQVRISKTPKITGRGQHYFVNRLVKGGVMS